jgi:N-acetylmuramoyl-L-alanine amidase
MVADAEAASSGGTAGKPHVRRISTNATAESTRVTIDLDDSVKYSSARIRNPDRIFFDLQAAKLTPELARASIHVEGDLLTAVRVAQNHAGVLRVVLDVNGVKDYTATLMSNPPELVIDLYRDEALRAAKAKSASAPTVDPAIADVAATDPNQGAPPASAPPSATNPPTAAIRNAVQNTPVPTGPTGPASPRVNSHSKSLKSVSTKPDLIQPSATPQPTRDGQATLTRALGLKIGRIVIDAGHGGHDTGTIGPTGLMEKDLCLDVALRLGKIVQQRLPGADVVFTRSDDTFVPLEERTRIANEAKADLFISIHANSSHDHAARGVETYYLNLKGSPDAMEVAARENATSQESVHDLEDLVKKIARSEKIDESREFAADIQQSLAKRIQKTNKTVKDRGVRRAPFVVLIGADMPSILTEISFLSNPADEQLLKKPEQRQKVAEGLYQGVASYLQSLNSVTVNLPRLPLKSASERSAAIASVEQSRNPQ